jgi:hypothetical protein
LPVAFKAIGEYCVDRRYLALDRAHGAVDPVLDPFRGALHTPRKAYFSLRPRRTLIQSALDQS